VIDRKKGTAKDGGLRTIERIPPEITFEGEILIRYMDEAELKQIMNVLDEAKKMLNNDYLGGSGSRGYGAVEVK
jgi:CRISPR-associated protein Csm3